MSNEKKALVLALVTGFLIQVSYPLAVISFGAVIYFLFKKDKRSPVLYLKPLRTGDLIDLPNGSWTFSFYDKTGKRFVHDLFYNTSYYAEYAMLKYVERGQLKAERVEANAVPPQVSFNNRKDKFRQGASSRIPAVRH